ncbi:MAG: formamidopyrimidine-DNA glycosylase [Gemmatimonadetes bacterium]|nr:formamidopyrimidine-DNA glycosylase [Gemmatimonadota bacterium]
MEDILPELPELAVYCERLQEALGGARLSGVALHDPFVLRTVDPAPDAMLGRELVRAWHRSKFLLLEWDGGTLWAFHLMLGGRLHLKTTDKFRPHRGRTKFSADFSNDVVLEMTEAGKKRRASLHVLTDVAELARIDRGVEPLAADFTEERLATLLRQQNRQLKKALRDPELLAGIGNAYSDEILFEAGLSPLRLTGRLEDDEINRLHAAIVGTLHAWIARVRERCPEGLPVKQDGWRRDMAVHGRTGEPCPRCGTAIERISYRDSETNYCPSCQNDGRVLADRRRSRLGIQRRPR